MQRLIVFTLMRGEWWTNEGSISTLFGRENESYELILAAQGTLQNANVLKAGNESCTVRFYLWRQFSFLHWVPMCKRSIHLQDRCYCLKLFGCFISLHMAAIIYRQLSLFGRQYATITLLQTCSQSENCLPLHTIHWGVVALLIIKTTGSSTYARDFDLCVCPHHCCRNPMPRFL